MTDPSNIAATYAERVRRELRHLPVETVADLTDGLESDIASSLADGAALPSADEYATDLLREEVVTRFQQPAPLDLLLHRQRASHGQALLLMLPSLAVWSRDPQLGAGGTAFQVAMTRG